MYHTDWAHANSKLLITLMNHDLNPWMPSSDFGFRYCRGSMVHFSLTGIAALDHRLPLPLDSTTNLKQDTPTDSSAAVMVPLFPLG